MQHLFGAETFVQPLFGAETFVQHLFDAETFVQHLFGAETFVQHLFVAQKLLTVHAGLQQLPVLLDIAGRDWHALALRDALHSSTGALGHKTPCNHKPAINKLWCVRATAAVCTSTNICDEREMPFFWG